MAGKPIERAVILMDQFVGELREDNGAVLGLDLWPELKPEFDSLTGDGIDIILAVPTDAAMDGLLGVSDWAPKLEVITLPREFAYAGEGSFASGLELRSEDPETAFISGDRRMRGEAARAGFRPAPHIALLSMMTKGLPIEAVRLSGPREALWRLGRSNDVVPMHFQPTCDGRDWALIGLTTPAVQSKAVLQNISVQALPYDPMTEDLMWARIDSTSKEAEEALAHRRILHAEPGQVLLALNPDEGTEALDLHGGHGHSEWLAPDPNLLRPASLSSSDRSAPEIGELKDTVLEKVQNDPLDRELLFLTRPSSSDVTAHYERDLDRYTGVTALDASGPIISRHTAHSDNKRVETALLADLAEMGYSPYRHKFTHAGETHSNIIADLPGNGTLRIKPEILAKYRKILTRHAFARPLSNWRNEMAELADASWFQSDQLAEMPERELRKRIEEIFHLQPWYPWWKSLCANYGLGADIIIMGCHLDSTAGFEPVYHAPTDPAPGRDDNGSGLAAALSMARYFRTLADRLTHTVRFCFFNAEESGLIGSKAYAAKMKSLNAPIRAVFCADMMGHNSDANRIFEIHAGFTDPLVRDSSLPFADEIANAATAYGKLPPAQIYKGTSWSGAPDRNVYDGAINRSDHAAFHQQGYGAVLVSEDFFANLSSEPGADPNPNYHLQADNFVDVDYAKDITCALNKAIINVAL